MKFEFGNKLTSPLCCDQVLVRVQGGTFYVGLGMCQPTFDDAKPPETCDIHSFVSMSPLMVKKLRDLLTQSVAQYEEAFGEIRTEAMPRGRWQSGGDSN